MSEFQDPELRNELARLSGPYPDDNAAFAAWQRRVGQVRRRRAVAWTTGAALSLIVATVAVAAVQRPDRHTVVPGKSADTSADVSIGVVSTAATTSTTTQVTAPTTTAVTTLAPETTTSVVETAAPETPVVAPGDPASTGTSSNGSTGSAPGSSKGHSGPPSTSTPDASQWLTQTFASVGGSITVRQKDDRLTVVAKNAAPGFEVTDSNRAGRKVEVTFESDEHRSTITVRISDGVMQPDVDENDNDYRNRGHDGSGPDDSAPDNTYDDGDGDGDGDGYGGDGGGGGPGGGGRDG